MVQTIMPYLYAMLAVSLFANVSTLLWIWYHDAFVDRSPAVLLAIMLGFETLTIGLLAVITGPYPLLDINHYRQFVVAMRGAMLPISISLEYMLLRHAWVNQQVRQIQLEIEEINA